MPANSRLSLLTRSKQSGALPQSMATSLQHPCTHAAMEPACKLATQAAIHTAIHVQPSTQPSAQPPTGIHAASSYPHAEVQLRALTCSISMRSCAKLTAPTGQNIASAGSAQEAYSPVERAGPERRAAPRVDLGSRASGTAAVKSRLFIARKFHL